MVSSVLLAYIKKAMEEGCSKKAYKPVTIQLVVA